MSIKKSLHLNSIKYMNLQTAFRVASESGFQAVEISVPKLLNYLDIGHTAADVVLLLQQYGLTPVCVNDIFGVESMRPEERKRIFAEMELLAPLTQAIGCNTLQVCLDGWVAWCYYEYMVYHLCHIHHL